MADELQVAVKAVVVVDEASIKSKDIPEINRKLASDTNARVEIIAGLNVNQTKTLIESQLKSISQGLEISIDTSAITKAIQQAQNIKAQINGAKFTNAASLNSADIVKTFNNTSQALVQAKQIYAQMSGVEKVTGNWVKNFNGQLVGFTVNIEKATGLVERLKYSLTEAEDGTKYFAFNNGTGSDSGVLQRLAQIDKAKSEFTAKIAEFKNSNTGILTGLNAELQSFETTLNNLGKTTSVEDVSRAFDTLKTSASEIKSNLDTTSSSFNKVTNAENTLRNMSGTIQVLSDKFSQLKVQPQEVTNKIGQLSTDLAQLNNYEQLLGKDKTWSEKYKKLVTDVKQVGNEIKSIAQSEKQQTGNFRLANNIKTAIQQVDIFKQKNTAALLQYGNDIDVVRQKFERCQTASDLTKTKSEWRELTARIQAAGKAGDSFTESLKRQASKFTQWITVSGVVMRLVYYLRQMLTDINDIDSAMTNLYKVTDETSSKYSNFLQQANKDAKELGQTVANLVEQTANWAKLGFNIDDSANLAKVSSVYSNVGEVDNETAVSDIVTAMKAFGIEAENSMGIIDRFNELGNKFATSSKALGEGLRNSASALALAGNDIDESLAMITAVTEITQDAANAGNAVKILSLRLRGMKGELEALGEDTEGIQSISKIQTQILNLTGNKVNIFDSVGNFKSTYKIMNEISKVWKDISQTDQAELLEIIAGKHRANSVAALLTNMSSAEKALSTSINSSGSAMKEQERWMDSIEAKTKQLEQAFAELAQVLFARDELKSILDTATSFVDVLTQIIDQVGVFPLLFTGITTFLTKSTAGAINFTEMFQKGASALKIFGKEVGKAKTQIGNGIDFSKVDTEGITVFTSQLNALGKNVDTTKIDALINTSLPNANKNTKALTNVITDLNSQWRNGAITEEEYRNRLGDITTATTQLSFKQKALAGATKLFNQALNTAGYMLLLTLAVKAVEYIDNLIHSLDKLKDKADNAIQEYENTKQELDEINQKLEENKVKIEEMNKNPLSITEEKDLQALKDQNTELEKQRSLLEDIANIKDTKAEVATEKYLTGKQTRGEQAEALLEQKEYIKAYKMFTTGTTSGKITSDWSYWFGILSGNPLLSVIPQAISKTTDQITDTENKLADINKLIERRNQLISEGNFEQNGNEISEMNAEITKSTALIADQITEFNKYKDTLSDDSTTKKRLDNIATDFTKVLDSTKNSYEDFGKDFAKAEGKMLESYVYNFSHINRKDIVSQDIQNMFDGVGDALYLDGNVVEQYEKIQKIIAKLSERQALHNLTSEEELLLEQLEQAAERLKSTAIQYGDTYFKGISAKADMIFDSYKKLNPFDNITSLNYNNYIQGLLKQANGNADLKKELQLRVDLEFPKATVIQKKLDELSQSTTYKTAIDEVAQDIQTKGINTDIFAQNYTDLYNALAKSGIGAEEFLIYMYSVKQSVDNTADSVPTLSSYLKDCQETLEQYADTIKDIPNESQMIADAFKEQADNGKLCNDTILDLIESGYASALSFDAETGQATLLQDSVDDIREAKLKLIRADLLQKQIDLTEKYNNEKQAVDELKTSINSAADAQAYYAKLSVLQLTEEQLAKYNATLAVLDNLNNNSSESSSGTGEDLWKAEFDKQYAEWEHKIAMEQATEEDKINWLRTAYKTYFSDLTKYQDEYWKYEEEVFNWEQESAKKRYEDEKAYWDNLLDTRKDYYDKLKDDAESGYDKQIDIIDAQIEAIDKEKDSIDKANDAKQQAVDIQNAELDVIKAKEALFKASQRTRTVMQYNGLMSYEQDTEAVTNAQNDLAEAEQKLVDAYQQQQIDKLDASKETLQLQKDELENNKDKAVENIELQQEQELEYIQKIIDILENKINPVDVNSNPHVVNEIVGENTSLIDNGRIKLLQSFLPNVDVDKLTSVMNFFKTSPMKDNVWKTMSVKVSDAKNKDFGTINNNNPINLTISEMNLQTPLTDKTAITGLVKEFFNQIKRDLPNDLMQVMYAK